jgi:hypothetical protein
MMVVIDRHWFTLIDIDRHWLTLIDIDWLMTKHFHEAIPFSDKPPERRSFPGFPARSSHSNRSVLGNPSGPGHFRGFLKKPRKCRSQRAT